MPTAVPYNRDPVNGSSNNGSSNGTPEAGSEADSNFSRELSPSLQEVEDNEIPTYFTERDDRLFHASPTSPYPLPVDTPEQERLKALHQLANQLIGANYVGPVPEVLVQEPGREKAVLDLGTGTGTWVMEMARVFGHITFRGIDIVPIATRYPLANVFFEVGDITEDFRWPNGTFDFIHAREITLAVRDYRTILPEVVRVLRPGGIFLSCEWERGLFFSPGTPGFSNPTLYAPRITHFFQILNESLWARLEIQTIITDIPTYLTGTDGFEEIVSDVHHVPVGPWSQDDIMRELGQRYLAILVRFADSVKPFLIETGYLPEEVDILTRGFVEEARTTPGLVGKYHTVYGIKG